MNSVDISTHRPSHLIEPAEDNTTVYTGDPITMKNYHEKGVDSLTKSSQDYIKATLALPRAKKPLDAREQLFVSHYLITRNALQSALAAGYAESTAKTCAFKWVKCDQEKNNKLHVFAALHENSQKIHEKAIKQAASKISAEIIDTQWVLNESVKHVKRSTGEIPTHISKRIDPLTNEETIVEHYDYDGNQAAKGIELVAKNKKIKAFSNELEINTDGTLAELLNNIGGISGPPKIERDVSHIEDAQIVEEVQLSRPVALPKV